MNASGVRFIAGIVVARRTTNGFTLTRAWPNGSPGQNQQIMRKRSPKTHVPNAKDEAVLQELNGLCEMGMQGEILGMADRVLSQKRPSPTLFNEAMRALLAHGDNLQEWTRRIENAYTAMSLRDSRMCRSAMLCFYHSLHNYQKALEFIPARFSSIAAPLELAFALDALVASHRVRKADALVPRCLRLFRRMGPCGEANVLVHSLASYFASKQDWENAILLWQQVIADDLLGPQAFLEIAVARAGQARQAAHDGLGHIKILREAPDDLAISLPGNLKARLDEAEIELRLLKASLDQCFPPEE